MKNRDLKKGLYAAVFTMATVQTQAAPPVDFSNLVEQVSPAVVSVNVVKKMSQEELLQQQVPEILRRFFGNQVIIPQQQIPQEKTGYGSAFFISKDGYLLTNHHVVEDASKVTIVLNDRRELDATVVGSDERTDVALLKVQGTSYPELRTGNVDQLRVGEPVLAIGSPFGFDYSASAGIVSAKMRNMMGETSVPFIQTDVALNPGNSGGPLFNQRGEVVGVNSRIFSGTGGYMGLSFSIPIDVAMDVADQLKRNGKVTRSYLGVSLQDIDRNLAESYKLSKPEGSLITQVAPNSPAARAGLRAGDVILKYNGTPISRTSELLNYLNRSVPNQSIQLEVLRDDKRRNITATVSTAPDDTPAKNNPDTAAKGPVLGVSIRDLSVAEQRQLDIKGGVLIQEVRRGGSAAQARIMPGDVIVQLNNTTIQNANQFVETVSTLKQGTVARVVIIRQGQRAIIGMRIQ
ncbi:Do family serine endopeptidase [Acinetobacter towneri]|uniref:Probable periplasmic serine endoprotease DegP-like n=1 Tax=Acinetobacter towneri TaxID=202956 RepID=A0AB35LZT7_9GAMM|nr:Do family serine endopeptidase [Acinetobacter towneri]MCA4778222.1 Do family serine endopeptidase [Acinetobacter towneri]MCA4783686.1 Do family serine endopeptidase [Acinetobacter towneri]MCA4787675.1 Do family serine endopeptidase [Acinetobacter towneri]MCA4794889.1 Do family serine endopeptidase [Acinetobacter towneri]MCA4799918.1 Do family serine endopeptidase [Acinetobacter towneri]